MTLEVKAHQLQYNDIILQKVSYRRDRFHRKVIKLGKSGRIIRIQYKVINDPSFAGFLYTCLADYDEMFTISRTPEAVIGKL